MTTKEFENARKNNKREIRNENPFRIFENEKFGKIEVLFKDDQFYFPAIECAKILGYKNPHDAVLRHCKNKGVVFHEGVINSAFGASQEISRKYISEGNLYRLIVKSKLPSAIEFEEWIFDIVIPSIRKHGYYSNAPQIDERDRAKLAVVNAATEEERMIAFGIYNEKFVLPMQKELEAARPKAENYDDFMNGEGTFSSGEIAKPFGLTAVMFNKIMKHFGLIVKHGKGGWEPSAKYLGEGIMKPVEYELKPKNSSSSLLQSSAKPPLLTSESKEESAVDKLNAIAAKFIDGFEYAGKEEKAACTEQEIQAGANLFQGKTVSFRWTARGLEKAKELLLNEGFVKLENGKWQLSKERMGKFREEIKSGQA
jgi:prophage antirepressor